MKRRAFIASGLSSALCGGAWAGEKKPLGLNAETFRQAIVATEQQSGGRLGVAMLDVASGDRFAYRGDERFATCSTFKLALSACILHQVDRKKRRLSDTLAVRAGDLVANSPLTTQWAGHRASLADLCMATMTRSDNAAANLLYPLAGAPAGLTQFLRGLGDKSTRLDRMETELNSAIPGDPRDTTMPLAMLGVLESLLVGQALSPAGRDQLLNWMLANKTGDNRFRAGLPAGWKTGDKTGAGDHGTDNDIGIVWPPARGPVLFSCYLTQSTMEFPASNVIHAQIARALVAEL